MPKSKAGCSGVATAGPAHTDNESCRDGVWRGCSPRVKTCMDEHLWRGNVAMNLVGARVRADVENGDDLATAPRQ